MLIVCKDLGLRYFQRMHVSHKWIIYATCSTKILPHPATILRTLINSILVFNVSHVVECSTLIRHDIVLLSIVCHQYFLLEYHHKIKSGNHTFSFIVNKYYYGLDIWNILELGIYNKLWKYQSNLYIII